MIGENSEELTSLLERFEKAPDSRLFAPLADARRKNGDLDRAIELCENGLKTYPDYASAHVILGKCYYDKGATERARAEFQRVLELDSENLVALKFMGDILYAEDKHDEAAEYFKKLLSIDPTNKEVSTSVGEIEKEFRIKEIDLEDDKTVRKVERSRELATITLAGIYAAQGYYNKALKIYNDIIRDQPDNREAQEMIEKLQSIMAESEQQRDSAFTDEVQTISLDDVSEDVVRSSAGSGVSTGGAAIALGMDSDTAAGSGEEQKAAEERVEEAADERAKERFEGLAEEAVAEAAGDRMKEAAEDEKAAHEEKKPPEGEAEKEDIPEKDMEGFQAWIEKLKGK